MSLDVDIHHTNKLHVIVPLGYHHRYPRGICRLPLLSI
nr:MAG TPA: hypothetical protein [Caudoviricetes sp.]